MLRRAEIADAPAIETFLARHADTSMFLRANLADPGPAATDSPGATIFWLCETAGEITGVIGFAEGGMLLVQMPELTVDAAERLAPALRHALAGRDIVMFNGEASQVAALLPVLGLEQAGLIERQPLYVLELSELVSPQGNSTLRPMVAADLDLIAGWRQLYEDDLGDMFPAGGARKRAEALIASGRGRVLTEAGAPVAMTAFNAALPDMVQIGNVFTPAEHRSRGYARRIVALHLQEAVAGGVTRAILFASGTAACRAYEAIGFRRAGAYTLVSFAKPQRISP